MKAAHSDIVKVNIEIVDSVDKALEGKCPQCDKQFRRKDVLKRHVKTVHTALFVARTFQGRTSLQDMSNFNTINDSLKNLKRFY